jgi:hypothetical protein
MNFAFCNVNVGIMKLTKCGLVAGITLVALQGSGAQNPDAASFSQREARLVISFDAEWRFFKGDAPGAQSVAFDDSMWRTLSVPHDWSIEGPFEQVTSSRWRMSDRVGGSTAPSYTSCAATSSRGKITLTASAPGLTGGSVTIDATPEPAARKR